MQRRLAQLLHREANRGYSGQLEKVWISKSGYVTLFVCTVFTNFSRKNLDSRKGCIHIGYQ
jgi:hypothetical protein